MSIITGIFTSSLLLITLLLINLKSTLLILSILALFYWCIGFRYKTILYNNGRKTIKGYKISISTIEESFASIKNIIIDKKQNLFATKFKDAYQSYRFTNAQSRVIKSV